MIAAKNTIRVLPQNLHQQRGASLLEGIAYLGIAAIVILGAISLLTGAFSSAQSNQVAEETAAIRTAVRKLHLGQGYGAISLNDTLKKAHAFPGTLTSGAAEAMTNDWGGAVEVVGAGLTFTVSYAALPQDVCVNTLVSAAGWQSVKVGAEGAVLAVFPITPVIAAGACVAGANTVVLTSV